MSSIDAMAPPRVPASPIQVADVILRAKQRADIEKSGSSGVISDSEALALCQQGAIMLDGLINEAYEYYTRTFWCFPTVNGQSYYALPGNFLKLQEIGLIDQLNPNFNTWTPLPHMQTRAESMTATGFFTFTNGLSTYMGYSIAGAHLELRPVRSTSNVGVFYTPQAPRFVSTSDYLPNYYLPGWEEYIVCWMAMMIAAKRQMANEVANAMWQEIKKQIASFIPNRDSANPPTVRRTWYPQNGLSGPAGLGGPWNWSW